MDTIFFPPLCNSAGVLQAIDTNFYAVCSQQEVKNVMAQIQYG
jgi:hypothetical protein